MIEQKIFSRMRFDTERMESYGFARKGTGYVLEKVFMDGDFTAVVTVNESGQVRGRVLDNMNDEEYLQLRMPNYTGAYVNTVRAAYEEVLRDIAESCCSEVAFASDQSVKLSGALTTRLLPQASDNSHIWKRRVNVVAVAFGIFTFTKDER